MSPPLSFDTAKVLKFLQSYKRFFILSSNVKIWSSERKQVNLICRVVTDFDEVKMQNHPIT